LAPPEEFYPREFADASRRVLGRFMDDFPDAVLIGGWASWARIGVLQSHDIDVIVGPEALPRIAAKYGPVTASTHIGGKKWRGEFERIHLDLYVPYQSRLGSRLRLRVEDLLPYAERIRGWLLLALPAHLTTKFAALLDRPESEPGEKDRLEIWRLLQQDIPPRDVAEALRASEASGMHVVAAVRDVFTFLEDLELDRAERQRLRAIGTASVRALEQVLVGSEEDPTSPFG
jgi:hypothetical protein